jgi:enoyl-CoA hydratase/carnithine racemase
MSDAAPTDELLVSQDGAIARIVLNRPHARNALTFAMYEGLVTHCRRIQEDASVKALVITGAGEKAFAAGTDIAMEAADVVIMNDDLGRIAETIRLSRRTHTVLWQNISLALGIKIVFFALAVFGDATMWMAVFADMGASLLVVANGLRLLRIQNGS